MPIDTAVKRAMAGSVMRWPKVGVVPDATTPLVWRAAVARSYRAQTTPPPPGGDVRDKFSLGTKGGGSITADPTLGGGWGQ